jgi:DNA-binding MarR family transcriptional regulator
MEVFMDQSLEPPGLTFAQYRALEAIDLNHEMNISELARVLRLSRQAAQMTVQKVNHGGLVDLIEDNGRVYSPTIMARHSAPEPLSKVHTGSKGELEEELSDGERHRLTQLLGRVDHALEGPRQPEWRLAP